MSAPWEERRLAGVDIASVFDTARIVYDKDEMDAGHAAKAWAEWIVASNIKTKDYGFAIHLSFPPDTQGHVALLEAVVSVIEARDEIDRLELDEPRLVPEARQELEAAITELAKAFNATRFF